MHSCTTPLAEKTVREVDGISSPQGHHCKVVGGGSAGSKWSHEVHKGLSLVPRIDSKYLSFVGILSAEVTAQALIVGL